MEQKWKQMVIFDNGLRNTQTMTSTRAWGPCHYRTVNKKVFSSHLWHLFFMLLDSYLWLVLWIKYTKVWCLICLPHVFWFIQNSFLCKLQFKHIGISFFLIFICKQNIQKMSVNAFGIKHNVYQDFWLNTSLFTLIRIFNPKWQKWQHHDKTC